MIPNHFLTAIPTLRQPAMLGPMFSALLALLLLSLATCADAQLIDALDAYPPRWQLIDSDCRAEVTRQNHPTDSDGRIYETIRLQATHGSYATFAYPIEPVRAIDDLTATVAVKSVREGVRVGLRVRFPFLINPQTRRGTTVFVYGSTYRDPGKFRTIGVGRIERQLNLKVMALRQEHGVRANLDDAYVDAIVLNGYCGPGQTSFKLSDLRVDGMVPVESIGRSDRMAPLLAGPTRQRPDVVLTESSRDARRFDSSADPLAMSRDVANGRNPLPFPVGRLTKILQHNGEPLAWVRSLGFNAVLLAKPPTESLLREAIQNRVRVYAPPPSSPDPELTLLLDPVDGWYLGSGQTLDGRQVESLARRADELRRWPSDWQRPLIAAPVESIAMYAPLVDGIIRDAPPRTRGLSGRDEIGELTWQRSQLRQRNQLAVGIASLPSESVLNQCEQISAAIGTPRPDAFRWHSMWAQVTRSLSAAPKAVLFRSTRPRTDGTELASQRSTSLSFVNSMLRVIEPWMVRATPGTMIPMDDRSRYLAFQLPCGDSELTFAVSDIQRGTELRSGDGQTIEIPLSPVEASRLHWRLTDFAADLVAPVTSGVGSRIQIVSPDVVEVLVAARDPRVGGMVAQQTQRNARQACTDRWQLCQQTASHASQSRLTARAAWGGASLPGDNWIQVAQQTLDQAEPSVRAGDYSSAHQLTRRADAWTLHSAWQLTQLMMPDWPHPTSSPPVDMGDLLTQATWRPLMNDAGWGKNRLPAGTLDFPEWLVDGRWKFGGRETGRSKTDVRLISRGVFAGPGALEARVMPANEGGLPGGYEGTAIQIQSPAVSVNKGTAIRLDVMVRTVGFGQPHQGLLVYDTVGGQEMGVLVRGRSEWTPVRLYRQAVETSEVRLMFELIGPGEAFLDEAQIRVWEPTGKLRANLYPLSTANASEEPPSRK
ncbi:MAG: hypothetical protein AAGA03_13510 [Planctomycetota bacterium]